MQVLNSELDMKNVGLMHTLADLRTNLDIYEILMANIEEIRAIGSGKSFFNFIRQQSIQHIALGLRKVFENEKRHPLTSLDGVIKSMLDNSHKYQVPTEKIEKIQHTKTELSKICKRLGSELNSLKIYRDKVIAHSEFEPDVESLPSFDAMTELYNFAYGVYALLSKEVVHVHPLPLGMDPKPKIALISVLSKFGVSEVKQEWT